MLYLPALIPVSHITDPGTDLFQARKTGPFLSDSLTARTANVLRTIRNQPRVNLGIVALLLGENKVRPVRTKRDKNGNL